MRPRLGSKFATRASPCPKSRESISRRSAAPAIRRQAAALVVLADLLGGPRVTSVMARDLMGKNGIALAAGASYSDTGLNRQTFALYVVPKPGVDPAEAEAALDALIARFLEQGPDPAEIARIKGRVHAANIYMLDDVSGRAARVGEALTSGLTLEDVEAWPDLLELVTVEDVRAAAKAVFRKENSVTGWLMPLDYRSPGAAEVIRVAVIAFVIGFAAGASSARAEINIVPVTSPGGIEAWLYEDHTIPILTIDASFLGGPALDPEGREGTTSLMARCWTKARAISTPALSPPPSRTSRRKCASRQAATMSSCLRRC